MRHVRSTEAPASPRLEAAKVAARAERRRGAWTALAGLVGAAAGLVLGMQSSLRGTERPQLSAILLFVAGLALYGVGLHHAVWAPTTDRSGVPPKARPWITAFLCLVSWWVLATISGIIAGLVRDGSAG
jgi:hypothetical protein